MHLSVVLWLLLYTDLAICWSAGDTGSDQCHSKTRYVVRYDLYILILFIYQTFHM